MKLPSAVEKLIDFDIDAGMTEISDVFSRADIFDNIYIFCLMSLNFA